MKTSWQFFAIHADTPSGFTWHWQKQGTKVPVTSDPFDFYFDCVSDARRKGYVGPLPAGPKVPLEHLPVSQTATDDAPVPLTVKNRSGQVMMTVTAVSALDARKRRASGRTRVT